MISFEDLVINHAVYMQGQPMFLAKTLHSILNIRTAYSGWLHNKVVQYGFVKNCDFTTVRHGRHQDTFFTATATKLIFCIEKPNRQPHIYTARKSNYIEIYNSTTAHLHLSNGVIALISPFDIDIVKRFRWMFGTRGYIRTEIKRKGYLLSRVIMGLDNPLTEEKDISLCVDHIDGDPINNRRENLRVCTPQQNMMNINCMGYHRLPKGDYMAYIRVDKKLIYLGRYSTKEAAQHARRAAELKYRGEYAVQRGRGWLHFALD